MIKQVAHVCIHAADLEATRHFYTEVLGLKIAFEFEREGELFGFYIDFGNNTFVEVFKGDPKDEGSIKHIAVEVEEMDALIEKIRSHGVEITDKKMGADNTWQSWVKDPNGVSFEFHEYTKDSMQFTGETCIVNW